LGRRFRDIAAGTAAHRDAEIGDGYRRRRYKRHIIIFKEDHDWVRILHVFHERMDVAGRIAEDSDAHSTQSSPISR
jgi:plasmid stabilization system protein ParE